MKRGTIIVDLQFGSTGKGLLAGWCAVNKAPDTVVAAWGPNAGHTYISEATGKMVNIALPNGIISPNIKRVMLGPGSVINPELLMSEMEQYAKYVDEALVIIHGHAAVVAEDHREMENSYGSRIGSTMKGVGEAVISKIRRHGLDFYGNDTGVLPIAMHVLRGTPLEGHVVTPEEYNEYLDKAEVMQVEGAQGFSLSINHGHYPYVTSRDCTVAQVLQDCAIPRGMWPRFNVIGTCRTLPIRVANRPPHTSGPGYHDQEELNWGALGIEPELTTVTRLPRRIFSWSWEQMNQAIRMNEPDEIFLNFVNYLPFADANKLAHEIAGRYGRLVTMVGVGPDHNDVLPFNAWLGRNVPGGRLML